MSFHRLIFYSAVISGWAAFAGWLLGEWIFLRMTTWRDGFVEAILRVALVGAAIGGGLNLVAGAANGRLSQQLRRLVPGLLVGLVGGIVGGLFGNLLVAAFGLPKPIFGRMLLRAAAWILMGLCIGVVEGAYEQSVRKILNGLLGGALGGLLGGLLFDPAAGLFSSASGASGRATSFVILGLSIGASVGLVQVALKEAWLTVLDGYRPGRQLILGETTTVLGNAEHVHMPFLGSSGKDLEPEHLRIFRQPGGEFVIEDNNTHAGSRLGKQTVVGRMTLKDGDVIRLGSNAVLFSERQNRVEESKPAVHAPVAALLPPTLPDTPLPVFELPPLPVTAILLGPDSSHPPPVLVTAVRLDPDLSQEPIPLVIEPIGPSPSTAASAASSKPPSGDGCPSCGRKAPGAPGNRYCMICDRTF